MDLQCGKQRQMAAGAACVRVCVSMRCVYFASSATRARGEHNECGKEIPKAHYVCSRSLTQARGLSSFGF